MLPEERPPPAPPPSAIRRDHAFYTNASPISTLLHSDHTLKQGLQVHAQLLVRGLLTSSKKLSLHRLLSFFALSGSPTGLSHSILLSAQSSSSDAFVYNTLIRGHQRSAGSAEQAVGVYKAMVSAGRARPNNITFLFLMDSCARIRSLELGRQVHGCLVKGGFEADAFVGNSIIHVYCCAGDFRSAQKLFDVRQHRDAVSFNTLITGYARDGREVDAFALFSDMLAARINPDERTFVPLLSLCQLIGLRAGKLVHQLMLKCTNSDVSNAVLNNVLVDMYAKCGSMDAADRVFALAGTHKSIVAYSSMISAYMTAGKVELAQRLFDEMPEKDLISWTAMINGYAQVKRYKESFKVFTEMEKAGIEADEMTMVTMLSVCGHLGALQLGAKLHQEICRNESFIRNPIITAALVDMYGRHGCVKMALEIFYKVDEERKTVSLFNSLISGLAQQGLGKRAVQFFDQMELEGFTPDEITFVGVLHACARSGLVSKGNMVFTLMVERYGIKPQVEHYGCMVNLFGQAGLLEEAYDFIEKMPFGAIPSIWMTLLSACRVHRNVKMADAVRKKLRELEPNHDYGSLSSMFANENWWGNANNEVKKLVDRKRMPKPMGWSYIEWNGSIHQFPENDRMHPQAKELNSKLKEMVKRSTSSCFFPGIGDELSELEDEKSNSNSHHSEKLALAFGLIHMDPDKTIHIIKNIRMCPECHSSFKQWSNTYEREITVRDRIRFHHMKNGQCSCGDWW